MWDNALFTLWDPFCEWLAAMVDQVVLELESLIGSMIGWRRAKDTLGSEDWFDPKCYGQIVSDLIS